MKRDDRAFVNDILRAAGSIKSYVHGMHRHAFDQDPKTRDAVIRQIGIIGEAANKLSTNFRQAHPKIPWTAIIGMRNAVLHKYWDVRLDIVWDAAKRHAPKLANELRRSMIVKRAKTPEQLDAEIAAALKRPQRQRRR